MEQRGLGQSREKERRSAAMTPVGVGAARSSRGVTTQNNRQHEDDKQGNAKALNLAAAKARNFGVLARRSRFASLRCQEKHMKILVDRDKLEKLANEVIGIAIDVHKRLGPGYVEKIYQRALYLELKRNKIPMEREYKITVRWGKVSIGYHVVDFLIDNKLLVEIKATGETQEIHKYQLLTYLKAAGKPLGLLLNFGSPTLGIKRVVNKL